MTKKRMKRIRHERLGSSETPADERGWLKKKLLLAYINKVKTEKCNTEKHLNKILT